MTPERRTKTWHEVTNRATIGHAVLGTGRAESELLAVRVCQRVPVSRTALAVMSGVAAVPYRTVSASIASSGRRRLLCSVAETSDLKCEIFHKPVHQTCELFVRRSLSCP
jgi:hypothetical protein